MLCFRKFPVAKKFMDKRGISRFSIENLLFHSTEKLRRGTLLYFTKFLVSKKIMDKRGGEREREGVSRFSVKNFLSHSAEDFRRGTLFVSDSFWYRKILWIRGRGGGKYQDFPWKIFSQCAENFRRGIL